MNNEIAKIIKEELGSDLTEEERKELSLENDSGFITKEDIKNWQARFKEIEIEEIKEVLSSTIKEDDTNKVIVFLSFLSVYTEDSQLNVSFNAPSSTGKSYIPLEIASLFPTEDVLKIGYSSPTAFFHDRGEFREEIKGYYVDLSRKILIFLDQPHPLLIEHLRPLLSHDEKEITLKIADKTQKYGLKTKNIIIRGFPVVVFCTAGLKMDEQEITRFILLSPEITEEKIGQALLNIIEKETEKERYIHQLEENQERRLLKERIEVIKKAGIKDIDIEEVSELINLYADKKLKPKDMRDCKKVIYLIKSFALLNFFYREIRGKKIIANKKDVENGIKLWKEISFYQEKGLPPYIYNFYKEVLIPAYKDNDEKGITINEILQKNYKVYETSLPEWKLKREILPMLSMAGLTREEQDPDDKRQKLIYPIEENKIDCTVGQIK